MDTGYVFLGVYRLSLTHGDTARCVWERVADRVDLRDLDPAWNSCDEQKRGGKMLFL